MAETDEMDPPASVSRAELRLEIAKAKTDALKRLTVAALSFQALVIVGAIVALSRTLH